MTSAGRPVQDHGDGRGDGNDRSLRCLLRPASVAVVGASEDPRKIGGRLLGNLIRAYAGRIVPINPTRAEVQGVPAFPSLAAVGAPVDLAIICVRPEDASAALGECARAGTATAVVFTSGISEGAGPDDPAARELVALRERHGMRILGPNCLGLVNLQHGLVATFADLSGLDDRQGGIAIVAQSGAMGVHLFSQAQREGMGVSYFISTGNQIDLCAEELTHALLGFDDVSTVLLLQEGLRDPAALTAAGQRAAALGKRIAAMKIGTTEKAALAAQSHTGSLQVADTVVDAAFAKAGIARARSMRELLDFGKVFAHAKPLRGPRVGILTGSGGIGVLLSDEAARHGLDVPPIGAATRARLQPLVPSFAILDNPIDYTGQIVADPRPMPAILDALLECDDIDAVVVGGIGRPLWETFQPALVDRARTTAKTFVVYAYDRHKELTAAGVPAVVEIESAMAALRALLPVPPAPLPAPPPSRAGESRATLAESASRELLRRAGIAFVPSTVVRSLEECLVVARDIGFPVALKLDSPHMPHKTEFGAVRLMLCDERAVAEAHAALEAIAARFPAVAADHAVTIQPNVRADFELFVGASRDPTFGPVVTVGLGGRLVEVVKESASCLAPLDHADARAAIARLCGGRLLSSPRGLSAAATDRLAVFMTALGKLLHERAWLREVDVNPLVVRGDDVFAVDALVVGVPDP